VVNIYKHAFTLWHHPGSNPGPFDPKSDTNQYSTAPAMLVFLLVVGFDGTSNVLAGKLFDIPVTGTQAHSFVSSFNSISDVADQVRLLRLLLLLLQQPLLLQCNYSYDYMYNYYSVLLLLLLLPLMVLLLLLLPLLHCVPKKMLTFLKFCCGVYKHWPIFVIFGTQYTEVSCKAAIIYLPISPAYCCYTTLGKLK